MISHPLNEVDTSFDEMLDGWPRKLAIVEHKYAKVIREERRKNLDG